MTAPLTGMNYNQLSAMMAALQRTQAGPAGGLGGINGFVGANYANGDVSAIIQLIQALMANQGGLAPTAAAGKAGKNGEVGGAVTDSKERMAIFDDLNKELGIANVKGSKAEWAKLSKTDGRITVIDKNTGQVKKGDIKEGDTVIVKSQKYGEVKIQAGGDGEMNGKDDAILAMGAQTATANAAAGLNAINQATPTAATPAAANQQVNAANTAADLGAAGGNLFNGNELNNLLAALLKMILEERGLAA